MTRLHANEDLADGTATDAEKEAYADMQEAEALREEAEGKYQDDWWYRMGEMTGYMPAFMIDIASGNYMSGGYKVAGKVATKAAVKAIGKEAAERMAKEGVVAYVKAEGRRGFGKAAGAWAIKSVGATVDDLLFRAPVTANTVQLGKTTADIIDRKLGGVTVDEDGNYAYEDDMSWGRAAWQGEANAIVEAASEMSGKYISAVTSPRNIGLLANVIGAKRLGGVLLKLDAGGLGSVMNTSRKVLEKMGISGYVEEVGEEYYGQLWRTMLNLDDAYQQNADGTRENLFLTGQFHGDIWGGMALSMGLLHGGSATLTGAQYAHAKHGVDKADKRAAELLGADIWEPLRATLDMTTNENFGGVAEVIMNDPELVIDEKAAVLDYMERSMYMRGFNLATMARTRSEGQDNDIQQANESYLDGYNASSAQEMNDAKNLYDYHRQQLAGRLGDKWMAYIDNDPIGALHHVIESSEWSEEDVNSVRDYINAKQVYEGMMQRVRDDIDGRIEQSNAMVDARVSRTTGMIQGATMKQDDRKVYVVSGNLVAYDDGTGIDLSASDSSIIVRDAETGALEQVAPDAILSIDGPQDPAEQKEVAAQTIREQHAQEAADKIDGIATFNPGATYTVVGEDGRQVQVQVTANGQGIVDNGDGTVNVTDGTNVFPMQKGLIQEQVDARNMARVAEFERQRKEDDLAREAAGWEARRPRYKVNDRVTLRDAEGNVIHGQVADHNEEDDMFVVDVDTPIDGRYAAYMSRGQLDGMVEEYNGEAVRKPAGTAAAAAEGTASPTSGTAVAENATDGTGPALPSNEAATTPAEETRQQQSAEAEQQPSAFERIPKDAQGQPLYEQADSDTAWDAIVEQAEGDEQMAQDVAASMVADKEAALKKIEKSKPKGGVSVAEKIAAERERKATVEQARQQVDIWKRIADTPGRRKAAIEAERRRAAEEAAALRRAEEERLRAGREEAERMEREALYGVPDIVDDTPKDARARGYRRVNGHKVDRQEPIAAVQGKPVEVKFSDSSIPGGHVALIDASQLQPSHVKGVRNPAHFIDEAQPKERNDEASVLSADRIAGNIRPEEITSSVTAYTGAPTVNARGEVIQGNNRSAALREMWAGQPGQAQKYKQYLKDHAGEFGLRAEDVEAMRQPVLVNMLDVEDEEAIKLGQFVAQDTESGGTERIKPRNAMQRMGNEMRTFANLLLRSADDETSFSGLVDANGREVLGWMNRRGYITPTQYRSAFDSKGNLTAEAKNDLKGIMYQSIFQNGNTRLEEMFGELPVKAQRAILSTAYRDYDSPNAERMIVEIQDSIKAYHALSLYQAFAEAKNFKEARIAVETWKRQYQMDDVTGDSYLPADNFSNFALHLATMYKGGSQGLIQGTFNKLFDLIQGTQEETLFEQPDNTPRTLVEAIKEVLNIDYNGQQRSNVLAGDNAAGQGGQRGGTGTLAARGRVQDGTGTTDSRRGTEISGEQGQAEGGNDSQLEGDSASKQEVYTLSSKRSGNGEPFYQDSNGNIDLVDIPQEVFDEIGYSKAPFRLTPSMILHVLNGHGKELGVSTVEETVHFVLDVMTHFDHVRLGYDGALIFSIENGRKRTGKRAVTILINSDNGKFYGLKTSGYETVNGLSKRPLLWERGAIDVSSTTDAASASVSTGKGSLSGEQSGSASHQSKSLSKREAAIPIDGGAQTEHRPVDVSVTASHEEEQGFSENKDTEKPTVTQTIGEKVAKEDEKPSAAPARQDGESLFGYAERVAKANEIEEARKKVEQNPTEAQKEAGNYRKGHVSLDGYDITIESPKGSVRSGKDASGQEWSVTMNNDYGYIRGTEGVDGNHIDVFLSDDPTLGDVYVVDQVNPDTGGFDEHKVMYGFKSALAAKRAYLANYSPGWKGLGTITKVSKEEFKKWVESSHRKTKPFAEYKSVNKADESDEPDSPQDMLAILGNPQNGLDDVLDAARTSLENAVKTRAMDAVQPRQVDIEGLTGDLRKDGEAKLSDHFVIGRPGLAQETRKSPKGDTPKQEAGKPKNSGQFGLVSDGRMEELKKRLRSKLLGQANVGVDPEVLAIGIELAAGHIDRGIKKFADFAKVMVDDLGDMIRPYLKAFYNGARDLPEVQESGLSDEMTPYDEVRTFDTANFDKQGVNALATAELVVAEQEANRQAEKARNTLAAQRNEKGRQKRERDRKKDVPSQAGQGDLFGNIDGQQNEGINENEVHLRNGSGTAGRERGHQPQQDEPLGTGAENQAERPDGRGVDRRDTARPRPDEERGGGVSRISEGTDVVTSPKNTRNNHSERGANHAPTSVDARIDANIKAIELSQQLIQSGETATPGQMEVLRRFSGWGGLGKAFSDPQTARRLQELLGAEGLEQAIMSANSAYYTPAYVVDTLWDIAGQMGFKGGNILEGSAGIGNILGQMPAGISQRSDIHAVEIDGTSGNILSLLYPDAKVEIQGFEQARIPNGSIDLAITNVPFVTGLRVDDTTGDKDLSRKFHNIHDFCIAKNVRKLREGGIGIFISSNGTLDSSKKLRDWIVGEGGSDFVGAFRLNNKTFGGTSVTSDIIVIRKRVNGRRSPYAIDASTVSGERTAEYDTGDTRKVKGQEVPIVKHLAMDYNRYFIEHPEHMAGEMRFAFEEGDTFRPTSKGLYPVRGKDQEKMLADFVESFAGKEWTEEAGAGETPGMQDSRGYVMDASADGKKLGEMYVKDGKLVIASAGGYYPLEVNSNKVRGHTKEECFNAYSAIKKALADVLEYQTNNEGDKGLKPLLDRLNKAYDDFVGTYGHFNKNTAIAFLRNDVDYPNVFSLEKFEETGDKSGKRVQAFGKSDVFSKRVVEKEKEPTPTNVKDGILASVFKFGRIDIPYIAGQIGESAEAVKQDIIEKGYGFENPATKQVEVSFQYLSGNVREKLRQAEENNENGIYDRNIKALQDVLPMDIPAHLIDFTLGSSWIDPKLYEDYVKERTGIDVRFTAVGGTWFMKAPDYGLDVEKNRSMGVYSEQFKRTVMGHTLIEAAIQNKTVTVSQTHRKYDGTTETVTDKEATQACSAKIDEIRQDFKDWARAKMQGDAGMSALMERIYNDTFNNYVPMEIPGEFVPRYFSGASHKVRMRPHQGKAIVRGTMQPLMLSHEVGTGKTYTLISTAMEMRRLGTARKPMIVVQNATVGQFVASAKDLYPNAKILTLEEADRNAKRRKNFYAKIRYNDWDMIVVPQSTFNFIPDSEERQMAFIQDKIEEKLVVLEQMKNADPGGKSMITRQAEREIEQLQEQLAGLADETSKRRGGSTGQKKRAVARQNAGVRAKEMLDRATDDVENFDDMGIDALLIDEAHEYKHLGFATAIQRGVKGVDPSYSKKSQGVYLKVQAVMEKTGGRNVIFATGTPISNTAAEIWTFMRYLMPADTMKDYGIYYFDDFVRNFGNIQQMLEFGTNGKFKENNRFAGYVNLPELVRIWLGVADIVRTKEAGGVNDKIPEMEGGKAQDIYLPQTKALRSIMNYVKAQLEEYEKMSGKEKKANSHIPLTMFGIAKAAAVDARLVQEDAADEPDSKTNEAVRQTLRSLKETADYKGTVAIFADNYQNKQSGFNLYEDIRGKLVAEGVPAEQIAVMKRGMTVNKKLEIFDKVNRGEVRVILGSTATLGTGVNIQERLHTLIHLDAPNRPMDYTQRNGRILRQGNIHKAMDKPVRILRFGVEDSLDVTAYQRLKTKGAIADSIMNGKQLITDSMSNRVLEEEEDVFGDTVAQLSGSEYAMLKNNAEKNVRKYESRKKQWEADQTYIHNAKPKLEALIAKAEQGAKEQKGYLEAVKKAFPGGKFKEITAGKHTFHSVDEMADYIKEHNKSVLEEAKKMKEGGGTDAQARNLTVALDGYTFKVQTVLSREMARGGGQLFSEVRRKMTYSCPELGLTDVPVHQSLLRNAIEDIVGNVITGKDFAERAGAAEQSAGHNRSELLQLLSREGKPFEFEKELAQAREQLQEYSELMKKEMAEKEAKYAEMDAQTESVDASKLQAVEEEDTDELYREAVDEIEEANERFNEQLDGLTEENADNVTLSLGRPSAILRAAGVEDKPMKLYGNKVIKKMKKHGFTLDELKDLPEAVADPIAVFNNYQRDGNRSILTEMTIGNKNILVSLTIGKGNDIDFNIVSSVFGKGSNNIVDWMNKGYATYINKKKLSIICTSPREVSRKPLTIKSRFLPQI